MNMKHLIALSAVLSAGTFGAALAQDGPMSPVASGTVRSVDPASRTVVLNNGQAYSMGESVDVGAMKPGSKVNMSCDSSGANCMVMASLPPNETGGKTNTGPSAGAAEGTSAGASEGAAPESTQGPAAQAAPGSPASAPNAGAARVTP